MVTKPKNWMVESILATLLCCMPFGIVGIINAAKVNSLYEAGDVAGAEKASKDAAKWVKIAVGIGLAVIVAYIIFVVLFVGTGVASSM